MLCSKSNTAAVVVGRPDGLAGKRDFWCRKIVFVEKKSAILITEIDILFNRETKIIKLMF